MKQLCYIDSIKYNWRQCPVSIQVAITDYCFNQCEMCGHWKRENKRHMPIDIWKDRLKKMQDRGLTSVCYSGGDPMMYPYLNELMDWHINNNLKFTIITAGFVPKKIDLALLKESKWVRISLDALDDKIYKYSRGGSLTPSMIKQSIEEMKKHKVNIQFNLAAHQYNVYDLMHVFDYALEIPVTKITIKPVIHEQALELSPSQESYLTMLCKHFGQLYDRAKIEHNLVSLPMKYEKIDRCFACLWQHFIMPDGSVYPCCLMAGDTEAHGNCKAIGNIFSDNLLDIWINMKYFSMMELPQYCHANCLERHRYINNLVYRYWNQIHFF